MMWGDGGWWVFMWMWMAVFWAAVVLGIVWLVRSGGRGSDERPAAELLDHRLASGEIEIGEYRRLKQEIGDGYGLRRRGSLGALAAAGVALLALVTVLMAIAALSDWDMWGNMGSMHGRGNDTSGSQLVQGGPEAVIEIRDFAFSPGNLEIPRGASVTWTNNDSAPHDATARGDAWRTERLSSRESGTIVFDVAGEYRYYCSIHPSMEATLRVR